MALNTVVSVGIDATLAKVFDLAPAGSVPMSVKSALTLANGTGANQADLIWQDSRSTAGNDDIDLTGVLKDFFGDNFNCARVKTLYIKNTTAAGGGNLIVGNGAAPWLTWVGAGTHTITIRPGGVFLLTAPDATAFAVTATTGDILRVAPSAGTVTFDIIVVAASV